MRTSRLLSNPQHRRTAHDVLLPALFQTRTILRHTTTGSNGINEERQQHDRNSPGLEKLERASARRSGPRRNSQFQSKQSETARQNRAVKSRHVPFDAIPESKPSSMTHREYRVFEDLFQRGPDLAEKGQERMRQQAQRPERSDYTELDNVLSKLRTRAVMEREFPEPLQSLAAEAKERQSQRRDGVSINTGIESKDTDTAERGPRERLKNTARSETSKPFENESLNRLDTIKGLMDKASTDSELWEIIDMHILRTVMRTQLDASHAPTRIPQAGSSTLSSVDQATRNPEEKATEDSKAKALEKADAELILPVLSNLLVYAMKMGRESFPTSPVALSIVPAVKMLGQNVATLGGSTRLFNHHMQLLYERNFDLDGVSDTLSDMDRAGHPFDGDTQRLLRRILRDGRLAIQGQRGSGSQALWWFDRKRRAVEKLRAWLDDADQRLEEEALQRSRLRNRQSPGWG